MSFHTDMLLGYPPCQEGEVNSLRPRVNRRPFVDDILKCIFLNENEWISPMISLKFASKVRINNIPALVQIRAWRRPGDKPLSEPMLVSLLTHICVTRLQWVLMKYSYTNISYTHIIYGYTYVHIYMSNCTFILFIKAFVWTVSICKIYICFVYGHRQCARFVNVL